MRKIIKLKKRMPPNTSTRQRRKLSEQLMKLEMKLADSHKRERDREEANAVNAIASNPKYFYTYAKSKSRIKTQVGPLRDGKGGWCGDPLAMANLLAEQYSSAFSSPKYSAEENEEILQLNDETGESLGDIEITEEDVTEAIKTMSENSAAGSDEVPAILLKRCAGSLAAPLVKLWQRSLDSGLVPNDCKLGLITPIYKGGERGEPKNYRPVTLTSHLIKIFERIVVKKVLDFLESYDLYNKGQHGFRKRRSCLSQLLQHQMTILTALE